MKKTKKIVYIALILIGMGLPLIILRGAGQLPALANRARKGA